MAFGIGADNITFNVPASGGILSGGIAVWNVTLDTEYAETQNWTNATIYLQSAGLTGNLTEILIASAVNMSTQVSEFNGTLNSSKFEDGNDYIFKVQLFNSSDRVNATITVTINNTIPQVTTSITPLNNVIDTDLTVNFTGSVIDSNTTSCTLEFIGTSFGTKSQAMGYNGDTCSLTLTDIPEQSYVWLIRSSDGSDTVDSIEQTIIVDAGTSSSKVTALLQEPGVSSAGGASLSFAGALGGTTGGIPNAVIVIVAGLAVFAFLRFRP